MKTKKRKSIPSVLDCSLHLVPAVHRIKFKALNDRTKKRLEQIAGRPYRRGFDVSTLDELIELLARLKSAPDFDVVVD